jgi:5-formyltetrahydrofolate cyclo-ligase
MTAEKELLREKYKTVRLAMGREEVISKSRAICRRLMAELDWTKIKRMHIYNPMSRLNEADTESFLFHIQNLNPEVEITVISSGKGQILPNEKFDLIVVPTLAFDKDNYRLGWGGGFYDRFLAAQPQALKIGLCFQNGFIEDNSWHQPHDIPLDKMITEV